MEAAAFLAVEGGADDQLGGLEEVPELDGWGSPYDFNLDVANPLAQRIMGIRSPGRDRLYSDTAYTVESFDPESFDEDIIWADGFFVRWPQKK